MPAQFDALDSPLLTQSTEYVSGGYIDNTEPHLLKPDTVVRLLNIVPTVAGRLQKRLGPTALGGADLTNPNSLHEFYAPLQNLQLLVGQWGSALYRSTGNAVWTRTASNVSLADTPYMGTLASAAGIPQLCLASCVGVTNNVSLPFGKLVCLDSNFAVTETNTQPRAIAWFQSRLWAFNLAATGVSNAPGPDYLVWTKPLDCRDFSNGQSIQIEPNLGGQGVALVPMRDGTPKMLLFKESSVHMLEIFWASDGYYPTTANALDFTKSLLRPITLATGCVATKGLVWVPGQNNGQADLLFLSREGLRSLSRSATDAQGGANLPMSFRVQTTIDRINWAQAHRAVAQYWNNIAYFALPVDGSDRNNFVLAYDTVRDSFYELDDPVADWTPAHIQNDRRFFFMAATSGTETGLGSPASGVTNAYHVYRTDDNLYGLFRRPLQLDLQTRAFTFDQSEPGDGLRYKKKWDYLDFAIQSAATGATLTISYKVDDDDAWTVLRYLYVDPTDGFPILPVQLPFQFSVGRVLRRSLLLRPVRPGFKIQFRVQDDSSFSRLKIISIAVKANPLNAKFHSLQ